MEILVTKDTIKINMEEDIHKGEYKINTCEFTFSEDYTQDLVKVAVFTRADKTTYRVTINNDECDIPYEALKDKGAIVIGVYAYKVNGEELQLRYSPRPVLMAVQDGSYIENTEESSIYVPASTIEEYEQQLQDLFADVEASKDEIAEEVAQEAQDILVDYMDQFVKVTATGQTINVNDSSNLPIKDFKLKGNTGKNMFNGNPNYSTTRQNVDVTINGNRITLNGTSSQYPYNNNIADFVIPFPVEPSTKYTYSMTKVSGSMTGNRLAINLRAGSTPDALNIQFNTSAMELLNGSNSVSFTSHTSAHYVTGLQFIWQANTVFDNYTFDIQLEEGSTATEYEPYKEVTGDVTVKVLGKNLIPFISQDFSVNNVRHYVQNGSLYMNGTTNTETYAKNTNYKNNFSFTLPAGTYYFTRGSNLNSLNIATYIVNFETDAYLVTNSGTFTLNEATKVYLGIYLYNKTFDNVLVNCQLELGSTATAYEPYTEQTQLLSLGDTKLAPTDEIARVNDEWCVNETPITDTTLKGQLQNIPNLHTYKNTTNILSTVPTGNVEPIYEITYIQDLETRLNNIEARLSLLE